MQLLNLKSQPQPENRRGGVGENIRFSLITMIMRITFFFLSKSGLPFIIRETIQRRKVTILLFHDIEPKTADIIFRFLKSKYNIISLNFFIDVSLSNNPSALPDKAIIITFDDGHIGNYRLLPVIREHEIPITIFLCAGLVNTRRIFWWQSITNNRIVNELRKVPNHKRLSILQSPQFKQAPSSECRYALSDKMIREMRDFVDFQSHTMSHPFLHRCSFEEAFNECSKSKEILQNQYGFRIRSISYPNGDYSAKDIQIVIEVGYECGITVDFGYNSCDTDLFKLARFSTNDTSDMNELVVKASGLWSFIKLAIQKIWHG